MRPDSRPPTYFALLLLAAAFVLGTGLLLAGSDPPSPGPPGAGESGAVQAAPSSTTPLPNFKPSEELPADAAVAFPTDI